MRDEGIRAVDTPPPSHSPDIAGVEYTGNEDLPVDSELSDDDDVRLPAMVPAPASSEEELRAKIIKQVEYYFSDENLSNDKFLLKQIKKDKAGFGTSDKQSTWMFLLVRPPLLWLCRASRVDLSLNEPETTAV